ncbi:hypothetical protein NL676_020720 [Syzygium grande]|nr:hypothetical protein NL676_020720 [Syzygium grande]
MGPRPSLATARATRRQSRKGGERWATRGPGEPRKGWRPGGGQRPEARGRGESGDEEEVVEVDGRAELEAVGEDEVKAAMERETRWSGGSRRGGGRSRGWAKGHRGGEGGMMPTTGGGWSGGRGDVGIGGVHGPEEPGGCPA